MICRNVYPVKIAITFLKLSKSRAEVIQREGGHLDITTRPPLLMLLPFFEDLSTDIQGIESYNLFKYP